ncbi:MAG: carboxymethylenebutenolidase, partial [Verrucomicrobia bacterium]
MQQEYSMGRCLVAALLAVIMCDPLCNAQAQDWAKGERTIKAFVVYPESKNKTPAVLVIHEIFGLTDWVRGVCDQLAENGVIAIAPDLLTGQTYSDIDGARKAISALSPKQIKVDLDAASDYALKIPAGNGTLGVCGFCWGGGVTFAYANENPKLKAAYSFYGLAGLTLSG